MSEVTGDTVAGTTPPEARKRVRRQDVVYVGTLEDGVFKALCGPAARPEDLKASIAQLTPGTYQVIRTAGTVTVGVTQPKTVVRIGG